MKVSFLFPFSRRLLCRSLWMVGGLLYRPVGRGWFMHSWILECCGYLSRRHVGRGWSLLCKSKGGGWFILKEMVRKDEVGNRNKITINFLKGGEKLWGEDLFLLKVKFFWLE